jgi:hypothetical protein
MRKPRLCYLLTCKILVVYYVSPRALSSLKFLNIILLTTNYLINKLCSFSLNEPKDVVETEGYVLSFPDGWPSG